MSEDKIEVVEYEDDAGKNAFALWLAKLDTGAFAKVAAAVIRMRLGNFGDVKPVGTGVSERRIDFGPGYRIYFRPRWPKAGDLAWWGDEEPPTK